MDYQAIIRFISTDHNGCPSRDSEIAAELCEHLKRRGISSIMKPVDIRTDESEQNIDSTIIEDTPLLIIIATLLDYIENDRILNYWHIFHERIAIKKQQAAIMFVLEGVELENIPSFMKTSPFFPHISSPKCVDAAMSAQIAENLFTFLRNDIPAFEFFHFSDSEM